MTDTLIKPFYIVSAHSMKYKQKKTKQYIMLLEEDRKCRDEINDVLPLKKTCGFSCHLMIS